MFHKINIYLFFLSKQSLRSRAKSTNADKGFQMAHEKGNKGIGLEEDDGRPRDRLHC